MKAENKQKTVGGSKSWKSIFFFLGMSCLGLTQVSAQTVASAPVSEAEPSKSWSQRMFGREDWAQIAHSYDSPREICRLIERNISYKTESTDQWSPAEDTWSRGKGDCEDFAILIQKLCQLNGMETKVHLYFPATGGREGHAVLVGEWNGKIWFSSNGSYEEMASEDQVRERVARMLSCKAKQLFAMKMTDRDVSRYIGKSAARSVASAAR